MPRLKKKSYFQTIRENKIRMWYLRRETKSGGNTGTCYENRIEMYIAVKEEKFIESCKDWILNEITEENNSNSKVEVPISGKLIRSYICTLCNFKTSSIKSLQAHTTKSHKGEKPFNCKTCGQSFATLYFLFHHLDQNNCKKDTQDKFTCSFCPAVFNDFVTLGAHTTKTHKRSKRKTPHCWSHKKHRNVINNEPLLQVGKEVESESVEIYQGEAFKFKQEEFEVDNTEDHFGIIEDSIQPPSSTTLALDLHNSVQKTEDEKPFSCDACRRIFVGQSKFTEHLQLCGEGKATKKSGLVPHTSLMSENNSEEQPQRNQNGKKKRFPCKICSKSFATKSALNNHMRVPCKIKRKEEPHSSLLFKKWDINHDGYLSLDRTLDLSSALSLSCKPARRRRKQSLSLFSTEVNVGDYVELSQNIIETPIVEMKLPLDPVGQDPLACVDIDGDVPWSETDEVEEKYPFDFEPETLTSFKESGAHPCSNEEEEQESVCIDIKTEIDDGEEMVIFKNSTPFFEESIQVFTSFSSTDIMGDKASSSTSVPIKHEVDYHFPTDYGYGLSEGLE